MTPFEKLIAEYEQTNVYKTILVDPPWDIEKMILETHNNVPSAQSKNLDYPTMSLKEIAELPIGELKDPEGAHLWLWTTQKYLPHSFDLVKKWGFDYHCVITWKKNSGFCPFTFKFCTEFIVFARYKALPMLKIGQPTYIDANSTHHSAKPEASFDLIERVSPEPRIELFARIRRPGWSAHGNQIEGGIEL